MSVQHELAALDTVSRDGELESWSLIPPTPSSFPSPLPPPSIGLHTWPTKLCCSGQGNFSHSLQAHIGVWFYLLAAVVVAPTWKLILSLLTTARFFVDASSEAFSELCSFPLQTHRPWLLSLKQAVVLLNCILNEDSGIAKAYNQWESVNLWSLSPLPHSSISSILLLMNSTHS